MRVFHLLAKPFFAPYWQRTAAAEQSNTARLFLALLISGGQPTLPTQRSRANVLVRHRFAVNALA